MKGMAVTLLVPVNVQEIALAVARVIVLGDVPMDVQIQVFNVGREG